MLAFCEFSFGPLITIITAPPGRACGGRAQRRRWARKGRAQRDHRLGGYKGLGGGERARENGHYARDEAGEPRAGAPSPHLRGTVRRILSENLAEVSKDVFEYYAVQVFVFPCGQAVDKRNCYSTSSQTHNWSPITDPALPLSKGRLVYIWFWLSW